MSMVYDKPPLPSSAESIGMCGLFKAGKSTRTTMILRALPGLVETGLRRLSDNRRHRSWMQTWSMPNAQASGRRGHWGLQCSNLSRAVSRAGRAFHTRQRNPQRTRMRAPGEVPPCLPCQVFFGVPPECRRSQVFFGFHVGSWSRISLSDSLQAIPPFFCVLAPGCHARS